MRTVRFPSLALAGATLALALTVSTSAGAASTFLLQFGTHPTEEAARAEWDRLQSQHTEVLGNMNVRVAPVDGQFRTQASGVDSRDKAQNACNRLSAENVPCMVVETSMYMPEQAAEDITVEMVSEDMDGVTIEGADAPLTAEPALAAADAPVAATAAPVAAPQEKSFREALLPWLSFGKDDEEPARQVQITENAPVTETTVADVPAPALQPAERPEPINRTAAARISDSLPAQQPVQQPALRPGETRVVAERAPKPLQAPASAEAETAAAPAPAPQPQVAPQQTLEAEVEVAEAIAVPLSFGNTAPVPVNKPVGYGGFPSQTTAERTLWVQLNSFVSKEAAMNYWRELSARNPELVRLLRARIISPWKTPGLGMQRQVASLRMGPFQYRSEVEGLCAAAAQSGLRCSMVQEVGGSTAANTLRRPAALEQHNRRQAVSRGYSRTPGAAPAGMYWLQLGAFASVAEAQKRWEEMQATHGDLVGRMKPQISYPALSSSPTPIYHLRTGPFVTEAAANGTCNGLQNRRVGCVVVQAR